ncbi:MAG: AAA-like domain-containing protein [Cyanobacteria bacterium P01_D01_bin.14]
MATRKILILAVNPKDTAQLRLDEEIRQVKEALKLADGRDRHDHFDVTSELAVRTGDLHRHLLHHKPHIVHFSGHGTGERGLAFEDKNGTAKLISTATLDRLFRLCRGVECVLLNACHSAAQIDAIAQYVGHVIGMNQAIGDTAAIKFAEGFYDGLGYGRDYAEAFEFGLLSIEAEGIPEEQTPVLKVNGGKGEGERDEWGMGKGEKVERVKGEGEKGKGTAFSGFVTPDNAKATPPSPLPFHPSPQKARRIFISYKRDTAPDEPVALQLHDALRQDSTVFIDQRMLVGTRWAEQIEAEIRQADALVVLLSAQAVASEMVQQEIALAHKIAEENGGTPRILPVRVAYRAPFQYPLSVYLDPINWAVWDSDADTPELIEELRQAIAGGTLSVGDPQRKAEVVEVPEPTPLPPPQPAAQPIKAAPPVGILELPEGTMDTESAFYIERDCDAVALSTIQRQGVTITIKGPRQMGKSSLLNRTMTAAAEAGKQVAFLDFQLFDRAALQDADEFYQQFCFWLTDELELEDKVEEYWNRPLGNSQRCSRYVSRHILKSLDQPLVLAMDEVERIFDTPFRNDFFSMLRSWHNDRAVRKIWKRLDLTLVTSTEPYQLIADLNQSPFNVGENLRLEDFSPAQVHTLNEKHGQPLNKLEEQRLMQLVNGHPYLVRKALYLVASGRLTAQELFASAREETGPFGDHLKYHLFRMYGNKALVQGFLRILKDQTCEDELLYFRLHGAGLVCREGQSVFPRCQLYADYFKEHLL